MWINDTLPQKRTELKFENGLFYYKYSVVLSFLKRERDFANVRSLFKA